MATDILYFSAMDVTGGGETWADGGTNAVGQYDVAQACGQSQDSVSRRRYHCQASLDS